MNGQFGNDGLNKQSPSGAISGYLLEIGSLSDMGCSRENNEDCLGYLRLGGQDVLAFLADGMGGCQAGERASQTATEVFQQTFRQEWKVSNCAEALTKSFRAANATVYKMALNNDDLRGMGTTFIALVIADGRAYYAHTGDSRLYYFSGGINRQLTQDHNLAALLVDKGEISPHHAKHHPSRHVLIHALGTQTDIYVDVTAQPLRFKVGDCFLLCSDGLHDLVDIGEMQQIIGANHAQQACRQLVELALRKGGYDNISVILVRILENP